MFSILRAFLPWLLYSTFYANDPTDFMIATCAALFSSILFDWKELKAGFILTWGTLIYFSALLIITLLFHWYWLQKNAWLISNLALAIITFGSAMIKKPFTMQYAKRTTPEDQWNSPLFIQVNYILTNIWGVIFLLTAIVNYFYVDDPRISSVSYFILSNIGWVIGTYITKRFPTYWKEKKLSQKF